MKRLNFTLDDDTVELLEKLASAYFEGNKSLTVRAALDRLSLEMGQRGWVVSGYTSTQIREEMPCHGCGREIHEGDLLFKPVFERGVSHAALESLPIEEWLECVECVEKHRF